MTTQDHGPLTSTASASTQLAVAAQAATQFVAPYLRNAARSAPDMATKVDFHDPVTIHDRHVEQQLREFLAAVVPGSRFLGEEYGEEILPTGSTQTSSPSAAIRAAEDDLVASLGQRVRWIVDPIDGTSNFAAGMQYFGTSIGVELDGSIVAGAVSVPCAHEVFVADSHRAWHMDCGGLETEIHADGPASEKTALIATYYPNLHHFDDPGCAVANLRKLRQAYSAFRSPGATAIDLAHVAAGWIGVSLCTVSKPWDVAAGLHIVRVAGGNVLNLPLGTDLPDGLRPGAVASSAHLNANTAIEVLRDLDARP